MKRIKAVVFDMDGVLVEAKEWHYESLNRALNLFGYNISREDHLTVFDGLPTKKKLEMMSERYHLPKTYHTAINRLKQKYTLDLVDIYCRPTLQHPFALSNLKADGYMIGVASNSIRKTVEVMMEKSGLVSYFDVMLSNEDVKKAKPAPDIYLKAAELLGVMPEECLVVEDNKNGIEAAKAAGMCLMAVKDINEVNYYNVVEHIRFYNTKTA